MIWMCRSQSECFYYTCLKKKKRKDKAFSSQGCIYQLKQLNVDGNTFHLTLSAFESFESNL